MNVITAIKSQINLVNIAHQNSKSFPPYMNFVSEFLSIENRF